jgi:hypothetical protein
VYFWDGRLDHGITYHGATLMVAHIMTKLKKKSWHRINDPELKMPVAARAILQDLNYNDNMKF